MDTANETVSFFTLLAVVAFALRSSECGILVRVTRRASIAEETEAP